METPSSLPAADQVSAAVWPRTTQTRKQGHHLRQTQEPSDAVAKANPGIEVVELDIVYPDSIKAVAKKLITEHPHLNVLINNAGIDGTGDQAAGVIDEEVLVFTVTTIFLGPIRLHLGSVDYLTAVVV